MAAIVRQILVVAGATALSGALRDALLARAAAGPAEFTLLLPADPGAPGEDPPARLLAAVERLRAEGLAVDGRLGDADPLAAVRQVWDPYAFDELVLSTYPAGRSRWLALDVPGRLERATGVIVARVVASA